jgi:uncharacterized protein YceK
MRKMIVLVAAAGLLSGCAGSTSTPSTSTASTPSAMSSSAGSAMAPSAEQTAWAGRVCTATLALKKDVEGLDSAVTSHGSSVSAALSSEIATIQTSANNLYRSATAVPTGSGGDPEAAAVKSAADQFKASLTALEASVTTFGQQSGLSKVTALASVGSAAGDSLSKLGTAGDSIKSAANDGQSSLGQAFAAAPACSPLVR